MQKCVIIGGGLAGLSAAVYLTKAGIRTELFEASPKLGGRAYSFTDPVTGDVIDNGQHIMMGCYTMTLEFLAAIGASDKLHIQPDLAVNFVKKNTGVVPLNARFGPYPFNLLAGLLNYRALGLKDKLGLIRLFSKLLFLNPESLESLSVMDWLKREGQSRNAIKSFWEILAVGTLNTDLKQASAAMFADILRQMFLHGRKMASIIIPATGLSQMYCDDASAFISENGGCIHLSQQVKSVEIKHGKIRELKFEQREVTDFDSVICAVPPYAFSRIFPEEFTRQLNPDGFRYSSILSVHLWLSENPFKERFYGLIDSPVQWLFNHDRFVTIVISNADLLIEKERSELLDIIFGELEAYFSFFNRSLAVQSKIIKEKRATFIPDYRMLHVRPAAVTSVKNLFLAGDWTNTGLPATIEGAVKSGRTAAELVIRNNNN
ncbi:MAG: hydroxysqualene dehydroxylase HpnE [Ignavibacteriales bacterium]